MNNENPSNFTIPETRDIQTKTTFSKSNLISQISKISEKNIFDPTDLKTGYDNKVKSFETEII